MLVLERPADLQAWVGRELGTSDWFTITQAHIDDFARLTGDDLWIHTDPARAAREMPGGTTIAHGFFVLSLIPLLVRSIYRIERRGRGLNYGSDRVRYTAPVPVNSRVRLRQTLRAADPVDGGMKVASHCEIEIEGQARPAVVAEFLMVVYDE